MDAMMRHLRFFAACAVLGGGGGYRVPVWSNDDIRGRWRRKIWVFVRQSGGLFRIKAALETHRIQKEKCCALEAAACKTPQV